ncbi:MAG: polymer-forming cytoskeletal protein [Parvibaculum sp.]
MFSRNKDNEKATASGSPSTTAPAPARRSNARLTPSIISNDLVVHGNLVAGGDIQIDGTIEGDIRSSSVTIGEQAHISGEVVADDIVIRGRVMGGIRGRRVQLCATCHVEGDILHEALAVETGAFFEGNCRHSDDPLAENAQASEPRRPQSQPQPAPAPAASAKVARPLAAPSDSPVVVRDGSVVVKRPAAE